MTETREGLDAPTVPKLFVNEHTASDESNTVIDVNKLDVHYGAFCAVRGVSMKIKENRVTAFIGPSGCGKSTVLRCFNRMNDLIPGARVTGEINFFGQDLYAAEVDPTEMRSRVGMVFQKPNPFPKSIYDNVAFGLKVNGYTGNYPDAVERSLKRAALWGEVKDRLKENALQLSGGQQQRLCIARALAPEPEVLLMDEPASALDPISTLAIEQLINDLCKDVSIIIVTHNMQQAARVSQFTSFFHLGDLVEYGKTEKIFTKPDNEKTQGYITGRFG